MNPVAASERPKQFYKYVSVSTAKLVLTNSKLRWSSPLAFNDVFDVPTELAWFYVSEITTASIPFAVSLFEGLGFANSSKEQREAAIALCSSEQLLSDEETKRAEASLEALRQQWRETVPTMRILCLCERPDIAAMWGLYADSNRGVVLRFDSLSAYDPPWLLAEPVRYSDTLPRFMRPDGIMEAGIAGPQALFDNLCYTKTNDWSHEREWRVLFFARRGEHGLTSDYPFFSQTLTEIILGPRISDQDRLDISALLSHDFSHVRLSQATPIPANRILIQPAPPPTEGEQADAGNRRSAGA